MTCPACQAEVLPADQYCEACGHKLSEPAPPLVPVPPEWVSSAGAAAACPGCAGTGFGPEGYCDTCGQRRPTAPDHSELALGSLAGVTDRGHRHHRNEDAMALGRLPGAALAVVCDGVSSSTRPDTASHAAVDAAAPALLDALSDGAGPGPAIAAAARAAQAAATLVGGARPGDNPPSCTFVGAVVTAGAVTVGWVGDSRAYWLPMRPSTVDAMCLTVDDSMAGQLAARGVQVDAAALGRQAGALLRWLGADATDTEARLRSFTPAVPGRVLLCSDGLSRYASTPAGLTALASLDSAKDAAAALVRYALDEGGVDNVTAVLIPFPPPEDTP
jgi:serine/threonine protein phosphatase PrpC